MALFPIVQKVQKFSWDGKKIDPGIYGSTRKSLLNGSTRMLAVLFLKVLFFKFKKHYGRVCLVDLTKSFQLLTSIFKGKLETHGIKSIALPELKSNIKIR